VHARGERRRRHGDAGEGRLRLGFFAAARWRRAEWSGASAVRARVRLKGRRGRGGGWAAGAVVRGGIWWGGRRVDSGAGGDEGRGGGGGGGRGRRVPPCPPPLVAAREEGEGEGG
jgi:hypothetical protein